MWGPWGWPMSGVWWVFPLIGMIVCMGFMAMMIWTMVRGGMRCMGHHATPSEDRQAELQREVRQLREELKELRTAR